MTRKAASLAHRLHAITRRFGYDVVRYPAGSRSGTLLQQALRETRADVVLDVGAHRGAFSDLCRTLGFSGPIVSFEPSPAEAAALARRAESDPFWSVLPIALGHEDGEAPLRLASAPDLTSLLPPSDEGLAHYHGLRVAGMVPVRVARLDTVLDDVAPGAQRAFLKIDTQGFDFHVLRGAEGVLSRVASIHVELSLQPNYRGSADYLDVLAWLRARGFEPADIVPGVVSSGLLAEADALLRRRG